MKASTSTADPHRSPQSGSPAAPDERLLLRAYGRLVELRGPAVVIADARRLLPPGYRPGRGVPERTWAVEPLFEGGWGVRAGGELVGDRLELATASRALLSDLELWVAEHARQRIFVHAGCVAVGGRAILLPGRTFAGKSTLTAALLRAGASYLSDEYAVIDGVGRVHPYPRPLSLRRGLGREAERISPIGLGAGTAGQAAQVALVARLRYDRDSATALQAESLTPGQGLMDLLCNTVPARSRPTETLAALAAAVRSAAVIRGVRGDADAAAAALLEVLGGSQRPAHPLPAGRTRRPDVPRWIASRR